MQKYATFNLAYQHITLRFKFVAIVYLLFGLLRKNMHNAYKSRPYITNYMNKIDKYHSYI